MGAVTKEKKFPTNLEELLLSILYNTHPQLV
jgi:hypothetical protein